MERQFIFLIETLNTHLEQPNMMNPFLFSMVTPHPVDAFWHPRNGLCFFVFPTRINKNKVGSEQKGFSIFFLGSEIKERKFAFCPFFVGAFSNMEQWHEKKSYLLSLPPSSDGPFMNSVLCLHSSEELVQKMPRLPACKWWARNGSLI